MTPRRPRGKQAGERRIVDRHRVPALTGIRGYAACWVVLFHASFVASLIQPALPSQGDLPLIGRGYLAVDLFFILSGYVLMMSHGEALAQRGPRAMRPFVVGRLFRILPLHWAVLALLALLTAWLPHERWTGIAPDGARLFLQNLALVQGWCGNPLSWNTPAWSLSAEWLAYLAFPALALGIARLGSHACLLVIVGGCGGLALAAGWHGDGGLNHVHALGLGRCLFEFPAGMAGYRLRQLGRPYGTADADRWLDGGIVLLALALGSPRFDAAAAPAFLLMVMAAGGGSGLADQLFGARAAVYLGEVSFSLYLLHFTLLDLAWALVRRLVPPTGLWVATTVAGACLLTVPAAHLFWRWIEQPGQALGRRLQRRRL